MARYRKRKKNWETGQAMVEWALVFPVFLMLVCGIIDFSWVGYQRLLFESSYQRTAWDFTLNLQHPATGNKLIEDDVWNKITPKKYNTSSPADVVTVNSEKYTLGEGIRKHMLEGAAGLLKEEELTVSGAEAVFSIKEFEERYSNKTGTESATFDSYQLQVDLTGDLEYRIELLTPISRIFIPSGEIILQKKLVRERTERVVVKRKVTVPTPP